MRRLVHAVWLLAFAVLLARAQSPDLVEKSRRAREAMVAARYTEAIPLYRELVIALPGNTGMRLNLALALHSAGRYREAIPEFRSVLEQQPEMLPAWLLLGLAYLKVGEPARAVDPLARVVEAEPANTKARLELADAYLTSGEPGKAVPQFAELTRLQPSDPKAWQGMGLAYVALSQKSFQTLEKLAPASPLRRLLLARSAAARGQSRSAMRLYREALARNPELRYAHAGLADAYRQTGHSDWARQEDERERALRPPDCATTPLECDFLAGRYEQVLEKTGALSTPDAHYWQSMACSELAKRAFARLAALPASPAVHELLADAARLQKNYALAAEEWREALKLAPGDRRLEKGLAAALWLNRDYASARPLLEKLVSLEPKSSELRLQLGDTLLAEDAEKALPHLMTALRLAPVSLEAHAALGRAYMRLGRAAAAIPHLKAALPLDRDGKLYYQLSQAYAKAGQAQLSREALAQYKTRAANARAAQPAMDEDEVPAP